MAVIEICDLETVPHDEANTCVFFLKASVLCGLWGFSADRIQGLVYCLIFTGSGDICGVIGLIEPCKVKQRGSLTKENTIYPIFFSNEFMRWEYSRFITEYYPPSLGSVGNMKRLALVFNTFPISSSPPLVTISAFNWIKQCASLSFSDYSAICCPTFCHPWNVKYSYLSIEAENSCW